MQYPTFVSDDALARFSAAVVGLQTLAAKLAPASPPGLPPEWENRPMAQTVSSRRPRAPESDALRQSPSCIPTPPVAAGSAVQVQDLAHPESRAAVMELLEKGIGPKLASIPRRSMVVAASPSVAASAAVAAAVVPAIAVAAAPSTAAEPLDADACTDYEYDVAVCNEDGYEVASCRRDGYEVVACREVVRDDLSLTKIPGRRRKYIVL